MKTPTNPLISIVVPAYNYGRFLGACIDGVLAQTYTNWELIVIDNGSSDNTQEVIAQYSDPRIRAFRIETNSGPVEAWALGYRHCRGDYFALLPADDCFLPTKLERQVEYLREHPDTDAVATYIREIDDDGNTPTELNWIVAYINQHIDFTDLKNWRWTHYFCIPSAIYSKELCDRANSVPSDGLNNICDWDFHVRLLGAGAKFAVIPEALTCYRWHHSNTSQKRDTAYSQWIYSHQKTYIPVLRKIAPDFHSEIGLCLSALYSSKKECYFIDGIPTPRRRANLEALLDPEGNLAQFDSFGDYLSHSDRWIPDTEYRAALAALDSSITDLRERLLKKNPVERSGSKQDYFPLEWTVRRLERENELIMSSLSWKLTRPLRILHGLLTSWWRTLKP